MSGVVILLIIIGIIFIFVSYAFAEKLEASNKEEDDIIEIPSELTDEQKAKISAMINEYMDENIDNKLEDIEKKFSEIVNEKTLALGDYAVTVNDEIKRNHEEVMFLYSMLSDKQKEIMTTANMVDDYRKDVEAFVNSNSLSQASINNDNELEEAIKEIDDSILTEDTEAEQIESVDSSKDVILEMHRSGLSILEIAKHLGLGVGEVKLIVDLYQGEE